MFIRLNLMPVLLDQTKTTPEHTHTLALERCLFAAVKRRHQQHTHTHTHTAT